MSYFINPVGADRCVFLSYEGETPAVELSAARYEAGRRAESRHWHRLVVDVTQLQSVPTAAWDSSILPSGLSSNISRTRRVALVVRPEEERHARLVQEVARRGRVFLTYFLYLRIRPLFLGEEITRQAIHGAQREGQKR